MTSNNFKYTMSIGRVLEILDDIFNNKPTEVDKVLRLLREGEKEENNHEVRSLKKLEEKLDLQNKSKEIGTAIVK